MVNKHLAIQMVEFMLHDTCQITFNPLVVVLEQLIVPLYMDACWADHLLVDGRQRQTALFASIGFRIIDLDDMWINKNLTEALILRKILTDDIEVDYRQTDGTSNLWCSQSDTLTLGQRFPHIDYQLLQVGIIRGNIIRYLS